MTCSTVPLDVVAIHLRREAGVFVSKSELLRVEAWAEDCLARHGYAVVSVETMRAIERIEAAPHRATVEELRAVLYAVYSGPLSDYWPPKVLA